MKHTFAIFCSIAAVAMSIIGCSKEADLQTPEEPTAESSLTHRVTVKVGQIDSKTEINEGASSATFKWSADDASRFYLKENEVEGSDIKISTTDSYSTISLSATFATADAAEYTYSGFLAKNKTGSKKPRVPVNQTCTASAYDPDADVLVAKPLTFTSTQDELEMQFTRPVVINKMTLKGLTEGETVSKVTITSDKKFTGYYDPAGNFWSNDGFEIVVNTSQVVPASGQVVIWFVSAPVEAATLSVVADAGDYTYSKTFGSTINLVQNQVTRFGVSSMTKAPKADYTGTYIITNVAGTKIADTYVSGNFLSVKDVTFEEGVVYYDPDVVNISTAQVTLTRISDSENAYYGMYTLVQNGKYLYPSSSSNNYLKAKTEADENCYWDVTFTDKWSIIASKSSYRNVMQFNNDRIACYSSASESPVALKDTFAPTPAITANTTIDISPDAVTSPTSTGASFNSNTSTVTALAYSDAECSEVSTWLTVSTSGSGSSTVVNYTASANTGGVRKAYIKITASNSASRSVNKVITVTQESAEEKTEYTITWNADNNSKGISSYTSTWTVTADGLTCTMVNWNNNNNGWAYVKCGRRDYTSIATITTGQIAQAIKTVTITIDALTEANINSIKLYISNDGSSWTEGSSFSKATGDQSVTIASPAADKYYKLEFDCASGSNGSLTLSKLVLSIN